MRRYRLFMIIAGCLTFVASIPADIVWSGDMYQRTYHEVPAIDFNLDGTNDFTFNLVIDTRIGMYYRYSIVAANGQIVVEEISETLRGGGYPLASGTVISSPLDMPGVVWDAAEASLFSYGIPDIGEEDYGGFFGEGYLGVSFEVDESTHYGWIEMSQAIDRPSPEHEFLYIHGWAWETEADTPILAGTIPEPSSGILTMVGSLALLHLARSRRRRKHTHKTVFGYRSPQEPKEPERW